MAFGASTLTSAGGAVSDLFGAFGAEANASLKAKGIRLKAQGDLAEAKEYDLAGELATRNIGFAETSTAIKEMQADREITMAIGGQRADVAGAGFADSGSALDLMADSARQSALTKSALGMQGLITEAGYKEQADSYALMSSTARTTAAGEEEIAKETESAGKTSEIGGFLSGALKGIGAIASIGLAPFTGGASLLGLGALAGSDSGKGG